MSCSSLEHHSCCNKTNGRLRNYGMTNVWLDNFRHVPNNPEVQSSDRRHLTDHMHQLICNTTLSSFTTRPQSYHSTRLLARILRASKLFCNCTSIKFAVQTHRNHFGSHIHRNPNATFVCLKRNKK